jgi:Uma2 family endonuclease
MISWARWEGGRTSSASLSTPALMTAEEYARRPDPGHPEELVRGKVVAMPQPNRRHGQICSKVDRIFGNFVEAHDLGHVLSNDAGVITERGPDTVRGADVAFYSYERLPRGPLAPSYGPEVPELVVEVVSPSDRWPKVLAKVAEYLEAGVRVVIVLDEPPATARVFHADGATRELGADDLLTVDDLLPGFSVPVRSFFV